jgi:hypothetical protein
MGQRVGDWSLEELFSGDMPFSPGSEIVFQLRQSGKEALDFLLPRKRRGVVPSLLALRYRERPIEQVADVRQYLAGRARGVRSAKVSEGVGAPSTALPPR